MIKVTNNTGKTVTGSYKDHSFSMIPSSSIEVEDEMANSIAERFGLSLSEVEKVKEVEKPVVKEVKKVEKKIVKKEKKVSKKVSKKKK